MICDLCFFRIFVAAKGITLAETLLCETKYL